MRPEYTGKALFWLLWCVVALGYAMALQAWGRGGRPSSRWVFNHARKPGACWRALSAVCLCMVSAGGTVAAEDLCAEVKIVIEQKMSLERQAFDARMLISNGLDASALQDVKIDLYVLDAASQPVVATSDANAAGAAFFYRLDSLSGIDSIGGGGVIGAKSEAEVHWLIVPSAGAGGDAPQGKVYYVGATVSYTLNGQVNTVDVLPDYIVVRPQPLLQLDYFLPEDVYADDAFTAEIEAAEPFTLGVRVSNAGAGVSYRTAIESAQPRIVENQQGLAIGFEILGGYVSDQLHGKSLLLNFGDIASGQAKVGRWRMATSLSGRFVAFDAAYKHADSLGGVVTSLLSAVKTHTLVHDVKVSLPGRDGIRDFLARDGDTLRVYESDNVDTLVTDRSEAATLKAASQGHVLTFPDTPGFVYVRVTDPFNGARPVGSVVRADGSVVPGENAWLSKTRDADLVWHYYVNVFDADSAGAYDLTFAQAQEASLGGNVFEDKNGNGVRDAGEAGIAVLGVTLKGVDDAGIGVSAQGHTDAAGDFAFTDLQPGRYTLQLATLQGFVDGVSMAGSAGGVVEGGRISDIVLTAGRQAQGYVLAKTKHVASTEVADVGIALAADTVTVAPGGSAALTLRASNQGPAPATDVAVAVSLPPGLTVSAATTARGSYDDGRWTLGTLDVGEAAELVLALQVGQSLGAQPVMAQIGAATQDPQTDDNLAQLMLKLPTEAVQPLRLSQQVVAETRLLMSVSCGQAAQAAACVAAKQNVFAAYFAQSGLPMPYFAIDAQDFHAALRSGAYNAVWISGGVAALSDVGREEVRALVRRGGLLVVEGSPADGGAEDAAWADVMGASRATAPSGTQLPVQPEAGGLGFVSEGEAWAIETTAAVALARFPSSGAVAVSTHGYGLGRSLAFGLDVAATLGGTVPQAGFASFLSETLDSAGPLVQSVQPARALVSVSTTLANDTADTGPAGGGDAGGSAAAALVMALADGMSWRDALPVPDEVDGQALSWQLSLAGQQEKQLRIGLRMPHGTGEARLASRLLAGQGQPETVATTELGFAVVDTDTLVPLLLSGLAAQGGALAAQARDAVVLAASAHAEGDQASVIAHLVQAEQALRTDGALDSDVLLLDIARWLSIAAAVWYDGDQGAPTTLQIVGGTPQSAAVGGVFAVPLAVRVTDAIGRPVAGVQVVFTMPIEGASARFDGGWSSASITTGADGIAQTGPLSANGVAGAFVATAEVSGLNASVSFELINVASVAVPQALEVITGSGQSTILGQDFSQVLSVRVVDGQGQGVPDVPVSFSLPAAGATARFAGDAATAVALSDALGVAASPLLTATGEAGSFTAQASVAGVAQPALFALSNVAAAGTTVFQGTTATGSGQVKATISGGGANCVFNADETKLMPAEGVLPLLKGILLPHGVLAFELVGCTPGGKVTVTTEWPNLKGITGYMKYGPTPLTGQTKVWYFPSDLKIEGNKVTYTIQDGKLGDDDLSVNGIIRDPGGPVIASAAAIPTLADWSKWLLIGLAVLVAAGMARRRPGRTP